MPPTASPEPTSTPQPARELLGPEASFIEALYEQLNPGVVSIKVFVHRGSYGGEGAGSGFVWDEEGYVVTNNHVVAGAERVTVSFFDGTEAEAEIVGTDADSDLAVLKVDELIDGTHPLALGDSDKVKVGQWALAIGNPFGLGGSMTTGIVSAVGRTIASGATPFAIPQAIQTDAAINPGNSGGPLFNLEGEIIGVNAQIATAGTRANAGVGFAIPADVVERVVPVLIESGSFQWPWLGVRGGSVNLALSKANGLETQRGAYIHQVVPDGPAAKAGLQGSSGTRILDGFELPIGGDVVVEADGEAVADFSALLIRVAFKDPGDEIELTVLRGDEREQVTVELIARPSHFDD